MYQQNHVPTNQENFGCPRTLTPKKKNVSSVDLFEYLNCYGTYKQIPLLPLNMLNKRYYCIHVYAKREN